MSAFNTVRFKIKPGREQSFLDAHKSVGAEWPGSSAPISSRSASTITA